MARQKYSVVVDGVEYSLCGWAEKNGVNHATVLKRWYSGIRDPHSLVGEVTRMPIRRDLTEEEKEWLKDVSRYSQGQEDHWKIMCDFAGVPFSSRNWLKEQLGEV